MFALLEKAEYIGRYDCKETNLQNWAADKKMSKCRENNGLLRGSKTTVGTFSYINDYELIHSRSHNKLGEEQMNALLSKK
jgi:hypothetical protein